MKKIPTLFEKVYENHKVAGIKPNITPCCEVAFFQGIATVKFDGTCCAIINGELYKRYDAKKGKNLRLEPFLVAIRILLQDIGLIVLR